MFSFVFLIAGFLCIKLDDQKEEPVLADELPVPFDFEDGGDEDANALTPQAKQGLSKEFEDDIKIPDYFIDKPESKVDFNPLEKF
ncbi:hypothetical protein BpHYR1_015695 [Brachionus plicatilis]|uniref:Uncharacterized protein n=1 Tax=Brachionus plicatilis TaxID=10195 RepID=A0A3M7RFI4_BRAPC|nr:hypothetical protein BpHYR1_015695 [Brachionus plicatilis]